MDKPILTVFTPAYNRADLLTRCYESMCKQTNKNFIWMIVDDGSTDNTREISESWVKNTKDFQVIYIYKENGGKHTALNIGTREATGDLILILDICFTIVIKIFYRFLSEFFF